MATTSTKRLAQSLFSKCFAKSNNHRTDYVARCADNAPIHMADPMRFRSESRFESLYLMIFQPFAWL